MILEIRDDMASEVMNTLAARAKYFEKLAETSFELEAETITKWKFIADEYWALVRQFSK
jgi:hypothetical protein